MAQYSQTIGTSLISHQAATNPATVKGSAQNVSGKIRVALFLFHALVEATANTDAQKWLIQASGESSGDEDWVTIAEVPIKETGTPATEALTATEPGGETTMAVASTTGFEAGDYIYLEDTGTLGDSEWALVQEIVLNTSIVLMDGLTNGKDSSDVAWGSAEMQVVELDVAAFNRIRVIYMNEGATAANAHIKATMTSADEFK